VFYTNVLSRGARIVFGYKPNWNRSPVTRRQDETSPAVVVGFTTVDGFRYFTTANSNKNRVYIIYLYTYACSAHTPLAFLIRLSGIEKSRDNRFPKTVRPPPELFLYLLLRVRTDLRGRQLKLAAAKDESIFNYKPLHIPSRSFSGTRVRASQTRNRPVGETDYEWAVQVVCRSTGSPWTYTYRAICLTSANSV